MRKLIIATVIFYAFLFCSCNKYEVKHTVQYFISSKSIMNVSYTDANGEILSVDNVSSAWRYSFNAPGDNRIVRLIVNSIDGGTVAGTILIDGQEAALNYSNAGAVSISTRLP